MKEYSTFTLTWQGITIEISFCGHFCTYGTFEEHPLAHLELRAIVPANTQLPMSSTGYKSHFIYLEDIQAYGSAQGYVLAWLEHEAQTTDWIAYLESQQQLSLF